MLLILLLFGVFMAVYYVYTTGREQTKYNDEYLSLSDELRNKRMSELSTYLINHYQNAGDLTTVEDIRSGRYNYRQLMGLKRTISYPKLSVLKKILFTPLSFFAGIVLLTVLTGLFNGANKEDFLDPIIARRLSNLVVAPLIVLLVTIVWSGHRLRGGAIFLSGLFLLLRAFQGFISKTLLIDGSVTSSSNTLGSFAILALSLTFFYLFYYYYMKDNDHLHESFETPPKQSNKTFQKSPSADTIAQPKKEENEKLASVDSIANNEQSKDSTAVANQSELESVLSEINSAVKKRDELVKQLLSSKYPSLSSSNHIYKIIFALDSIKQLENAASRLELLNYMIGHSMSEIDKELASNSNYSSIDTNRLRTSIKSMFKYNLISSFTDDSVKAEVYSYLLDDASVVTNKDLLDLEEKLQSLEVKKSRLESRANLDLENYLAENYPIITKADKSLFRGLDEIKDIDDISIRLDLLFQLLHYSEHKSIQSEFSQKHLEIAENIASGKYRIVDIDSLKKTLEAIGTDMQTVKSEMIKYLTDEKV